MVPAAMCAWPRALRPAAVAAVACGRLISRAPCRPPAATSLMGLHSNRWSSCSPAAADASERRTHSYWHEPGREPLLSLTLGQLLQEAALQWPHRDALISVHQGRRVTFRRALDEADKLAAGFMRIGLHPGDMLALCGTNSLEWYITFLAAARAGLILVNINPAYQVRELEFCLVKMGVKALIITDTFKTQNYYIMLQDIAPELPKCQPGMLQSGRLPYLKSVIIISDKEYPGTFRYESLLTSSSSSDVQQIYKLQEKIQPDSGCNLQFTSGTTGLPKGTLLSHHGVVNNAYFSSRRLGFHHKHHKVCLQVPLFHCFGNVLGIVMALHSGATLVLPSFSFRAEDTLSAITKEKCTIIYGTPTMFIDIVSKSQESTASFSSLEFAIVAGAPVPPSLFHKISEELSLQKCYSVYGMTETSPLSFVPDHSDSIVQCSTTVGRVMDHVEVKVVDAENKMVPMGQPGELLVRGPGNMLCYYNDEDKTKEIMGQDRWMRTGDQFVLYKNGYGEVVGRLKDMIIRGGENIFPREIEDYLLTHHDVIEAQVIGVPDERMGEEICACLRLTSESQITATELKDFCKGQIAHFKIPKYFIFMEDYPRTLSGKIQKFKLRDMVITKKLHKI